MNNGAVLVVVAAAIVGVVDVGDTSSQRHASQSYRCVFFVAVVML